MTRHFRKHQKSGDMEIYGDTVDQINLWKTTISQHNLIYNLKSIKVLFIYKTHFETTL